MTDWIRDHINPLGTEKKKRGSLYRFIGRVFERVRDDAIIAHNAFFPFAAVPQKVEEHAKALIIPHIENDTEDEFRNRVATASFFLSRAGERAYILEQLEAHLEDRFTCKEEFLQVFVKIIDLEDKDRKWVLEFLDMILDPNISVSVAAWFHFIDILTMQEVLDTRVNRNDFDSFGHPIKYNGAIKYDGHTVNDTVWVKNKYDGTFKYNGAITYNGSRKVKNLSCPEPPFKYGYSSSISDTLSLLTCRPGTYTDTVSTAEETSMGMIKHHKYNGAYQYNGAIKYDSGIFSPLT
jgi:hypothetical protein